MAEIVCFLGVIGSGKDYQAQKLVNERGFVHINFADDLRQMAWDILGWKPETPEEYEWFKKQEMVFISRKPCDETDKITGRQFLQNLGTEAMRKRDPNFWANCWRNQVLENLAIGKNVCCSDLRFSNELSTALSIKKHYLLIGNSANLEDVSTKLIFCDYKSSRYDATNTHKSEKLAQALLSQGYQDGDILDKNVLIYRESKNETN